MLQLRLTKGLDCKAYHALYGKTFTPAQQKFIAQCVAAGYATFDGDILALTPSGLLMQNAILVELL